MRQNEAVCGFQPASSTVPYVDGRCASPVRSSNRGLRRSADSTPRQNRRTSPACRSGRTSRWRWPARRSRRHAEPTGWPGPRFPARSPAPAEISYPSAAPATGRVSRIARRGGTRGEAAKPLVERCRHTRQQERGRGNDQGCAILRRARGQRYEGRHPVLRQQEHDPGDGRKQSVIERYGHGADEQALLVHDNLMPRFQPV
jgi:hypothetical protein